MEDLQTVLGLLIIVAAMAVGVMLKKKRRKEIHAYISDPQLKCPLCDADKFYVDPRTATDFLGRYRGSFIINCRECGHQWRAGAKDNVG